MPAKYSLKIYVPKGYYHVYNRGVEKKDIFLDEMDFRVFLKYLRIYLRPKEEIIKELKRKNEPEELIIEEIKEILRLKNFYQKIEIHCYVLMPNHFHFLLRQQNINDMEEFLRSLMTKYVAYFNKKYKRVGPLFQGKYKAILITKEEYFLHLSRYIHLNPKEILTEGAKLLSYSWSSYPAYVKGVKISWLFEEIILSYFKSTKGSAFNSYQGFVEGYQETEERAETYMID